MPRKQTIEKAKRDRRAGKSPSTQAGEFVKEEMDKILGSDEHDAGYSSRCTWRGSRRA